MQHLGNREHLLVMPDFGNNEVTPGDYYVAVIGEGNGPVGENIGSGTSDVVLRSVGNLSVANLGTTGATDLTIADTVERTELKGYEFTVPVGTLGVEVSLEGVSGAPYLSLAPGALPRPDTQFPNDFGYVGGRNEGSQNDEDVVTVQNPTPGIYRVLVRALSVGVNPAPAGFTLRVRAIMPPLIPFDGGTQSVVGQEPGTWRFFRVDVPAGTLGWDIRATQISGLTPNLHIARAVLPLSGTQHSVDHGQLSWPVDERISPFADWMNGSLAPDFRQLGQTLLVTGMGRPLEPGTYYVGVTHPDTPLVGTLNYTLQSRAIGAMGSGASLEVTDLPFTGGTAAINNLAPHEAAYFKVTIPAATRSWKMRLGVSSGELMMAVRKDSVPGTRLVDPSGLSNEVDSAEFFGADGIRIRKVGNEHFTVLPDPGVDFLDPGDYYIAVVSEGAPVPNPGTLGPNPASGTLTSIGTSPVHAFGLLGATALQTADTLENGENKMYSFEIAPGTEGVQIILENPTGKPQMAVVPGDRLPQPPTEGSFGPQFYGFENGETAGRAIDDEVVTLANPTPGIWHIVVRARDLWPAPTDATYTLKVIPQGSTMLPFDGGTVSVSNQATASWQYFEVTVPPGANGWDVRLDNVTSGDPKLIVRRATQPTTNTTNFPGNFGSATTWPIDRQYTPSLDYSELRYLAGGTENLWGRTLTVGMGRPLEPGTYYVGVTDAGGGDPMSYVIRSRGIGVGMTLPVTPLAFAGGSANITALPAREPTFFKVSIPANVRSWKVRLGMSLGDASLYVLRDTLPNMISNSDYANGIGIFGGLQMQQEGNEHFLLLPPGGSSFLVPGDYYLAVNSEGINPSGFGWPFVGSYGTGSTDAVIESIGEIPPTLVTPASPPASTSLEGGEFASYQFDVAPNTDWVQLQVSNVIGNPSLSVALDDPPQPYIGSIRYGFTQGHIDDQDAHPRIITLLTPTPGTYTALAQAQLASAVSGIPASFDFTVRQFNFIPLNFDSSLNGNGNSHQSTHTLIDDEKIYYRVVVPAQINGQDIIGWKIDTDHVQGDTTLHVFRDPSNPNARTRILPDTGIISTPYLTPGVWYVEAEATGLTDFTITSSAIWPERSWTMPIGHPVGGPIFGDSGVDSSGTPLPGDGGIDLAEDDWHFYAVDIPQGNGGVLRTVLENISGNPNLYLQPGHIPTPFHGSTATGFGANHYRSSLTGTGTEFGNWVPESGYHEMELTPGFWYLGVRAEGGSNARYRLKVGTAVVTPLALSGGSATNIEVANKDIRYFQVDIPQTAPSSWDITFSESVGAVKFWIRDIVPPGNTTRNISYASATSDRRNFGPYLLASGVTIPSPHSIPVPPLRPGHTYFIGFQAETVDSVFSVSSNTSGPTINPPVVPFYGGQISTTLAPGAVEFHCVPVPSNATRWKHTSTHASGIGIQIEQGTLPPLTALGFSHYRNFTSSSDTLLNQALNGTWPWLPGFDYYIRIENTTASSETVVIDLDGKNIHTEDEDNDGLPDAWERTHFGDLPTGRGDIDGPDNDSVALLLEYAFDMDPTRSDVQHLPNVGFTNLGGADYLTITYRRRIGGSLQGDGSYRWNSLSYQVEASADLVAWNSGPTFTQQVSVTPDANGTTETVVERCLLPIGSGCDYLRVRVESN